MVPSALNHGTGPFSPSLIKPLSSPMRRRQQQLLLVVMLLLLLLLLLLLERRDTYGRDTS